jgi:hypothetical protein
MTYKEGSVTIRKVEPITEAAQYPPSSEYYTLPSPIKYSRAIMYPKDYFIIFDRASSPIKYKYTNAFHFASLNINKTTSPSGYTPLYNVGNVKGTLTVQGTPINWNKANPFVEYDNRGQSNRLTWNTTNLYGRQVNLNLFTSPKTNYSYEKMITRVAGGYGGNDRVAEVFTPFVYFNQPANKTLYRVTALLTKYGSEKAKTPSEIPVKGTGSAIKVISANSSYTDYIYTGSGNSTFNGFTTDADTAFIRKTGQITDFTLINGAHLYTGAGTLFESSTRLKYIGYNKTGTAIQVSVSGNGPTNLHFHGLMTMPTIVKCNGKTLTRNVDWLWDNLGILTIVTC